MGLGYSEENFLRVTTGKNPIEYDMKEHQEHFEMLSKLTIESLLRIEQCLRAIEGYLRAQAHMTSLDHGWGKPNPETETEDIAKKRE